jgi:chemotaxis response regulator CheB
VKFVPSKSNQKVIILGGGEGSLKSISYFLEQMDKNIPATIIFLSEFSQSLLDLFFTKAEKISNIPIKILFNEFEVLKPGIVHVMTYQNNAEFIVSGDYLVYQPDSRTHMMSLDDHYIQLGNICAENLTAVMLSGRGEEGVEGFGKINEFGGLALSQLPQESVCHEKPFLALFQNKSRGAICISDFVDYLRDVSKKPLVNYERSTYL